MFRYKEAAYVCLRKQIQSDMRKVLWVSASRFEIEIHARLSSVIVSAVDESLIRATVARSAAIKHARFHT
jgi:hypothetical protein